jgi:hypothetical protein
MTIIHGHWVHSRSCQWKLVFASVYVTMEWLTFGEFALPQLTTIIRSQFGTVASVFVLTARQVSFLTVACGMGICSLSPSCQLDLVNFHVLSSWFGVRHCVSSRRGVTFAHRYVDLTFVDKRRVGFVVFFRFWSGTTTGVLRFYLTRFLTTFGLCHGRTLINSSSKVMGYVYSHEIFSSWNGLAGLRRIIHCFLGLVSVSSIFERTSLMSSRWCVHFWHLQDVCVRVRYRRANLVYSRLFGFFVSSWQLHLFLEEICGFLLTVATSVYDIPTVE